MKKKVKTASGDKLSKRELISAMALQGILADPTAPGDVRTVAKTAVDFADALIEELEG